ncbi:MAG: hypothetical protein ACWA41_02785 [Putridiphycobacter sp.]
MQKLFWILNPIVFFLFLSCESQKHIQITVLNDTNSLPIDSAYIEVSAGKNGDFTKNQDYGFTNKKGQYETYMMIGCAGGCYDIKINISKEGYQEIEILNQLNDTILLTPIE